ncbi:MAG: YneF family protein [Mycoplasmoidaceae bacterium]|nr:YneF family protein [Mycoplasmoidaceae bacterium]
MSTGGIVGLAIGLFIAGIIIGILIGFAIGQKYFKKQLQENPPVTREQIKAMYQQMGRTPSESQINQVMEAMKRQQK